MIKIILASFLSNTAVLDCMHGAMMVACEAIRAADMLPHRQSVAHGEIIGGAVLLAQSAMQALLLIDTERPIRYHTFVEEATYYI